MIPLPGFKPNDAGGYDFCPQCAFMWVIIGLLLWHFRHKISGVFTKLKGAL